MRTSFFTFATLLAGAFAMPANLDSRQAILCTSGTAQCCDVDVLGVADLDCETPPTLPANITDFNNICAGVGKIDMCCILPILNQGILCSSPSPS